MKNTLYNRMKENRDTAIALLCVILAITTLTAPVVAQSQISTQDTFEDDNVDGWTGENTAVVESSIKGDYSLFTTDQLSSQEENTEWTEGPTLDLNEDFTVQGTSRIPQDTTRRAGFGLVEPDGTGVLLLFSGEYGSTFIATSIDENPDSNNLDQINDYYDNEWVEWEITSSGDGEIKAKVWQESATEPTDYQISRNVTPESGFFRIFTGVADSNRDVYLDQVSIEGTTIDEDPDLRIDTGNYLPHGETQPYSVLDIEDTSGAARNYNDVTENATVTSGNTEAITVDEQNNELVATGDENVSARVNITAQYEGRTTRTQVTVATPTVDNLDVLPSWWRFSAVFLDRTLQILLSATLFGVAASRIGGTFSGIAVLQMVVTGGWFIGWVSTGVAILSLFTCLFVGLNVAANIDYSVRR